MWDFLTLKLLGPFVLRMGLASIFVIHGLAKVNSATDWGTSWDTSGEYPPSVQFLVAWGELLGGVAVAFGFFARIASVGIAVIMLGAIVQIHGNNGFFLVPSGAAISGLEKLGYEYNLAIIVLCANLFITGPGILSLDQLLFSRGKQQPVET